MTTTRNSWRPALMDNKTLLEHITEKRREIFGYSQIRTIWEALEAVHEIEGDIEINSSMSMPRKTGFIPPELSKVLEEQLFKERQEKARKHKVRGLNYQTL